MSSRIAIAKCTVFIVALQILNLSIYARDVDAMQQKNVIAYTNDINSIAEYVGEVILKHFNANIGKWFTGRSIFYSNTTIDKNGRQAGQINCCRSNECQYKFIAVARCNTKIKSQLHIDYYNIAKNYNSYAFYTQQQDQLNTLIAAMKAALDAGNISQKDFLQLQSLSVSLQQDSNDVINSTNDAEADLKTPLHISANTFLKPETEEPPQFSLANDLDFFIHQAKENNPYYKLQQQQTIYQQQMLAYQKASRVPDVTLTPNYAPEYYGMGVSVPLPLFNKNKGNIASASYAVQQQQSAENNAENELENNVANAYNKLSLAIMQNGLVNHDSFNQYNAL